VGPVSLKGRRSLGGRLEGLEGRSGVVGRTHRNRGTSRGHRVLIVIAGNIPGAKATGALITGSLTPGCTARRTDRHLTTVTGHRTGATDDRRKPGPSGIPTGDPSGNRSRRAERKDSRNPSGGRTTVRDGPFHSADRAGRRSDGRRARHTNRRIPKRPVEGPKTPHRNRPSRLTTPLEIRERRADSRALGSRAPRRLRARSGYHGSSGA